MPTTAIAALKKASKGLLYPSESDEPFQVFTWGKGSGQLTAKRVRELAGHEGDERVEEVSVADFFKDLTADQDWHGRKEKAAMKKFRALEQTLAQNLADAQVFRVGETNLDIYIVGKTADGEWAGLHTQAVET